MTKKNPNLYEPGLYWKEHHKNLAIYLKKNPLSNFRNSKLKAIQAFSGSSIAHNKNYRPNFWKLHNFMKKIPFFNSFVNRYDYEISRIVSNYKALLDVHMRTLYYLLKDNYKFDFENIEDSLFGNPYSIIIEKKRYSYSFLQACSRFVILNNNFKFSNINSIVELGGGYGALAEIILKRYKHIKYTLIDLPNIVPFCEGYLTKTFHNEVLNMSHIYSNKKIDMNINNFKERIIISPNNFFEKFENYDLFINEASFQEMDKMQVIYYCNIVSKNSKNLYLHNTQNSKFNDIKDFDEIFHNFTKNKDWINPFYPGYYGSIYNKK